MKKTLKWVVLAVVLVVVIGLLALYLNLNRIVKNTVEKQSTASLNLSTTLDGAALSLFGGKVSLDDVKIASPAGFKAPQMFTLDGVDVEASVGQLRSDPIRVSAIRINKPTLVIEQVGGKFNISAAMEQMPKTDAPATGGERQEGQPIHLTIDDLAVNNATVIIRPGLGSLPVQIPGLKEEYTLTLPPVRLKDIGTGKGDKDGATIKEVAMTVMTKLASEAANSEQLPPELRQILSGDLSQITAQLREQFNAKVEQITADVSKKIGDQIDKTVGDVLKLPPATQGGAATRPGEAVKQEIQKGIGDLLGGKKK